MKQIILSMFFIFFLINACTTETTQEKYLEKATTEELPVEEIPESNNEETALVSYNESSNLRIRTFETCQDLLNQEVEFKGKIIYEDCGKNCLGGCPGSGPEFCYYGIKNEKDCLVFVKSRIKEWKNAPPGVNSSEVLFKKFEIGQDVTEKGIIQLVNGAFCSYEGQTQASCSYFVLGEV